MSGETDLDAMLATLSVTRRPGVFTVTTTNNEVALGPGIEGVLRETEATTVIATIEAAQARGWNCEFQAAWLTLDVHSSLEGVGLTAAFSTALASRGIACNVMAGYFHDHLLVPIDRVDDALGCLAELSQSRQSPESSSP